MSVAFNPQSSGSASASLYVGDLSTDVNETILFETFGQVGPVASIRVCRDAMTRRSLGYAYVNYHTLGDAERALETLNFSTIKSRPCRIMWSERDPSRRKNGVGNIFVKNLAPTVDNKSLHETFSMFGNIVSVKVATTRDGVSLGYGFVHFDSDEAAAKAIEKVNGMVMGDRQVSVEPFKPKPLRPDTKTSFTNVYVKNIPPAFTQEQFDQLFGQYGTLTSAALKMKEDGTNSGFGFVCYETHEQAEAAIAALNDKDMGAELKLYVSRAQKKSEREKELADKFNKYKAEKAKIYAPGCNLYVKNLSEDVTDDIMRSEFGKFGGITSAKVMMDGLTQRSRGFGFVCFTSAEDATKAVTECNKKMFYGMPLYVGLAQTKESRREHLERQFATQRAKAMQQGMPAMAGMMPQFGMYPAQQMYGAPQNMRGAPGGGRGAPMSGVAQGRTPMLPAGYPAGPRPMPGNMYMGGMVPQQQQQQQQARAPRQAQQGRGPAPQAAAPMGYGSGADQAFVKAVAAATPENAKTMIGEKLYPRIDVLQPGMAGKITGMLLEMDNTELIQYLEDDVALKQKVVEAMEVLRQAGELQ